MLPVCEDNISAQVRGIHTHRVNIYARCFLLKSISERFNEIIFLHRLTKNDHAQEGKKHHSIKCFFWGSIAAICFVYVNYLC